MYKVANKKIYYGSGIIDWQKTKTTLDFHH